MQHGRHAKPLFQRQTVTPLQEDKYYNKNGTKFQVCLARNASHLLVKRVTLLNFHHATCIHKLIRVVEHWIIVKLDGPIYMSVEVVK